MPSASWHLYIVRTRLNSLYTGITTDVRRRLDEHSQGLGARSLRAKGPLKLVYQVKLADRGLASQVEYRIKQLPKREKEALVSMQLPTGALLETLNLIPGKEPA